MAYADKVMTIYGWMEYNKKSPLTYKPTLFLLHGATKTSTNNE